MRAHRGLARRAGEPKRSSSDRTHAPQFRAPSAQSAPRNPRPICICLLAILWATLLSGGNLLTAPGEPLTPGGRACTWAGTVYPHGGLRCSPLLFNRNVVRNDIHRCQATAWIELGSSDEEMPDRLPGGNRSVCMR